MDAARRQRIDEVFAAALELPAGERDAFLAHACGNDAELRREVESLLAHHGDHPVDGGAPEAARMLVGSQRPSLVGRKLGPYEILAPLGAGGMGEVYRARDTRLGRSVAIKVMPPHMASDPDARQRFEREARAISALAHPHICALHDVGNQDGVEFLVMELIEGETLASRLARGPISLAEALRWGAQVADALARAHRAGIVHRDLKPSNVMLTRDGVKLLDFGLARKSAPVTADSPTRSTAASEMLTGEGTILGTLHYMAPEQVEGKVVDQRADIFALGAMLYELVTGVRAFDGTSPASVIGSILRDTPVPLSTRVPLAPPALDALVAHCLAKDPEDRWQSARDLQLELLAIAAQPSSPAAAADQHGATLASSRLMTVAFALLALAVGTAAGWLLAHRPQPELGAGARWALAIPDGLSLSDVGFVQLALSDDGHHQAIAVADATSTSHLLLRSDNEPQPRLLPDTERALSPFFSPDGKWIGFFRGSTLFKIPTAGGPPVQLARAVGITNRGGTWSRDGFIYFPNGTTDGLLRVPDKGGPVTAVTKLDFARDDRTHRWPQALPDGRTVIYTADGFDSIEYYDDARIEAVRPATGDRHVILEGASMARYVGGGKLIFARDGSLFAVSFDPRSLTVSGVPEPVVQGVLTGVGTGAVQFALSPSGAALWMPGGLAETYRLVRVDRQGTETAVPVPPVPYNEAALSPDGKRLALIGGGGGIADLWVADLERDAQVRLTHGMQGVFNPVWSPDGERIAYVRRRRQQSGSSRWQLVWQPADGSRDAEVLLDADVPVGPSGFTPDGRTLLYVAAKPPSDMDVYLLPLDGSRKPRLLLGGGTSDRDAVVSPDGRFVAYSSFQGPGDPPAVFVRPFPAGEGRWQISTPPALEPRWSRDGRELFYRSQAAGVRSGDRVIYRVAIETRNGFVAGKPEPVVDRTAPGGGIYTYGLSPDGKQIITKRSPEAPSTEHTVFLDLGFLRRIATPSAGAP
jgi:eukaryotic-like serine/threonine-protein kinase